MQKHTKIYMDYFGYGEQDYIESELSGLPASSVHHILYKSQGGKDIIENLIALTQDEHSRAHFIGNNWLKRSYLQNIHNDYLKKNDRRNNIETSD